MRVVQVKTAQPMGTYRATVVDVVEGTANFRVTAITRRGATVH